MGEPTNKIYSDPVELGLDVLAGKWKPAILQHLRDGVECFGELRRRLYLANQRTLVRILADLERDHLVQRVVHTEVPLRVEYVLTEEGRSLGPVLDALTAFGREYAATHEIELLEEVEDEGLEAVAAAGGGG